MEKYCILMCESKDARINCAYKLTHRPEEARGEAKVGKSPHSFPLRTTVPEIEPIQRHRSSSCAQKMTQPWYVVKDIQSVFYFAIPYHKRKYR